MVSYKTTRTIQRLLILAILVVVSLGIFFVAETIVDRTKNQPVDLGKEALLKTSDGYMVSLSVRGPIVADEDFRSYEIVISPNMRELSVYEGYKKNNLDSIKLNNNLPAYEQFVYALDKAGFMDGSNSSDNKGVCATGYIYEFATIKDEKNVKKVWSSSCNNDRGISRSSVKNIVNLFLNQIKGGEALIEKLW
ncbi:MAG: hypothetical protein WBI29_01140 [Candidatus Saccharimonadales bacterium]